MGRFTRLATVAAATAALTAGGALVAAAPAEAAGQYASCDVIATGCTSGVIRANGSGHFIDIAILTSVFRGANYRLWDYDNGQLVASGRVGSNRSFGRRVTGLYGQYAIQLTDTVWDSTASIDNY